jgi:methionine-rich copper-binding protein CopC
MMVRRHCRAFRVPVWLIVLALLLTASVIAERAKAGSVPADVAQMEHYPKITQIMSGRGIAFALSFDQIVSHHGSQVTLVSPAGNTRHIPVRLVARPNTLHAAIGSLEPGSYVLQWQAQAADGTRLPGRLAFTVSQDTLARKF